MWWVRVILVLLLPFSLLLQQGSSSTTTHEQNNVCPPSSCGKISNVSYPFRLKDDPVNCGDKRYELACENNVTTLNLYSGKYHVQSINYNNLTIRVSDPGVQQDNCSSLPLNFLSRSNFCDTYRENCTDPYHAMALEAEYNSISEDMEYHDYELLFEHVVYLNCSHPVTDNRKYVKTTPCINWPSKEYYIYAIAGHLIDEDFQVGCHIKLVAPSSWKALKRNQVLSYNVIHRALVYGFEISWLHLSCKNRCGDTDLCSFNVTTETLQCDQHFCYSFFDYSTTTNCGKDPSFQLILISRLQLF